MGIDFISRVRKDIEMRMRAIDDLKKILPRSIRTIDSNGFLVSYFYPKDILENDHIIVDFTSEHVEHLYDLEKYAEEIYKRFGTKDNYC